MPQARAEGIAEELSGAFAGARGWLQWPFANLAVAGALFWLCARVSRDLLFSATRRQLRPNRLELV